MQNRLTGSVLGSILAVAAMLVFSPVIFAQTAAQSGAATPDLSGTWELATRGADVPARIFSMEEPPLQPWAMEKYKAHREGVTDPSAQGLDELDPNYYCFPPGVSRSMITRPFEIVQFPDRVYILHEYDHGVRRIYMDGRGHPDGWPFGWMGHSIGEWDGDTLVVDTVGLNDKTWIDRGGTPHSDQLHIVERFRRVDRDTLEIEFLFDDPKAFTKPWGGKKVYQLRPDLEILEHVTCEENLQIGKYREAHWPPGQGQ